jgi:hypothetical protein
MYNLDFETMKQVMQEHQKTGLLHAEVPSGVASLREPCRIEINIMAGTVVSCSVFGKSGRRLTGVKAVKEISRLGQLRWNFTSQEEATIQQVSPAPSRPMSPSLGYSASPQSVELSLFPVRTANLEQWQMRAWPRTHRAIFALADGTKNIEKIAAMLSISPGIVYKATLDLQTIGVLILGPENRNNFYF